MATNSAPRLIALCGPAGVGKSEVCEQLVRQRQMIWVRVSFAQPLKNMMRTLYEHAGLDDGEIHERLFGNIKETPDPILGGTSPRSAMQTLGTEWGRDLVRQDLWVSLFKKSAQRWLNAGVNVVVDDLRFPNEADAVRDMGGEIWQVRGPLRREVPKHVSEGADLDPCGVIENNGDLALLWDRVDRLLINPHPCPKDAT